MSIKLHKEIIRGNQGPKECLFHIYKDGSDGNTNISGITEKEAIFIHAQLGEFLSEEKLINRD